MAACVTHREALCVGSCQAASATFVRGVLAKRTPRTGTPRRVASPPSPSPSMLRTHAEGAAAGRDRDRDRNLELPSVFVLGCEACGSGGVASLLDLRAELSLGWPLPGEPAWRAENPSFLSQEDLYARGAAWYRAHFARRGPHDSTQRWVDSSRGSLAAPFAPQRLKFLLEASFLEQPQPKLVALLHDPVAAAWALWRGLAESLQGQTRALLSPYLGSGNFTRRALGEAAALSRCFAASRPAAATTAAAATGTAAAAALPLPPFEAWQRCVAVECGWPNCVVAAGLYALQLRAWRAAFPPRAFALFTLGEWHRSPAAARRRLFGFLGLPTSPPPPPPPSPQPTSRRRLASDNGLAAVATTEGSTTEGGGGACADEQLRTEAAAALARGRGVPRGAAAALGTFYAGFSAPLRSELTQLAQPLHRTHPEEAWLWLDKPERAASAAVAAATAAAEEEENAAAEAEAAEAAVGEEEEEEEAAAAVDESATALPTLFLLGGEKCGSTSLAFALTRHPQLHMARHALPGEPAYFRKASTSL